MMQLEDKNKTLTWNSSRQDPPDQLTGRPTARPKPNSFVEKKTRQKKEISSTKLNDHEIIV